MVPYVVGLGPSFVFCQLHQGLHWLDVGGASLYSKERMGGGGGGAETVRPSGMVFR